MSTVSAIGWVREMLKQREVAYEELYHPEVFTAQDVAATEHVSGHRVAKVVVVMVDGCPLALVLPASRHVDLERVRRLLGAKDIRLATEGELARYFDDCELGAIPPLPH